MQVVGSTNNQEVYVATVDRKFNINEYLIIEDKDNNEPVCEVVETSSFNKFVPLVNEKSGILDDAVKENLSIYGFNLDEETVNLAKVRVVGELSRPIAVGARVRLPLFEEVEHLLMKKRPDSGLTLGIIRGTEEMQDSLPNDLKNVAMLYKGNKGVVDQNGVPFVFDYYELAQYPHILISGSSGSGKSFGVRVLLEEKMEKGIPMVIFDPHYELDFSESFDGLPKEYETNYNKNFTLAYVGKDIGVDFTELTTEELCSLLSAPKAITSTMETALALIHEKGDTLATFQKKINNLIAIYTDGTGEFDIRVNEGDRFAAQILDLFNRTRKDLGTSAVMALSGIAWRLENVKSTGIFNCNINLVYDMLLKRKTVIIRSNIRLLRTFAGYLMNNLYKKRRMYIDNYNTLSPEEFRQKNIEKFPPFEICIDEAHNFCPKSVGENENMTPTKWIIREISSEGRKYGINLILVTQRPSNLDTTVIANINTKIIYRTNNSYDLNTIAQETSLTGAELDRLKYFESGNCFVSTAIIGRCVAVTTRVSRTKSPHIRNPFDELNEYTGDDSKLKETLKKYLPLGEMNLSSVHMLINKEMGRVVPQKEIFDALEEMYKENIIGIEDTPFGDRYVEKE
jgi:hypothetical protein